MKKETCENCGKEFRYDSIIDESYMSGMRKTGYFDIGTREVWCRECELEVFPEE
jgi:DNA-directed RNA polymerase subunit RPC12/RpoP